MSGRIVFVREGWQLRPSETATADDYAAWVKNGAPPAPTAADIDALVKAARYEAHLAWLRSNGLHGNRMAGVQADALDAAVGAALRELLGVKS